MAKRTDIEKIMRDAEKYVQSKEKESSAKNNAASDVRTYKSQGELGYLQAESQYLNDRITSANKSISNLHSNWQSSTDLLKQKRELRSTLGNLRSYQKYMNKYMDVSNKDTFNREMDSIASMYESALRDYGNLEDVYGQFANDTEYRSYMAKQALKNKYANYSYEQIQDALKKAQKGSEEYNYLSEYMDYSDLRDFDKALAGAHDTRLQSRPNKVASGETIKQGEYNMYIQDEDGNWIKNPKLYGGDTYKEKLQQARNVFAIENKFDLYKDYLDKEDFAEGSAYDPNVTHDVRYNSREKDKRVNALYAHLNGEGDNSQTFNVLTSGYDLMTDEEKAVFNYKYKVEGIDSASDYLDEMDITLSKRRYDSETQQWEEFVDKGKGASVVASAMSVPYKSLGALTSGIETVKEVATGHEFNPYASNRIPTNFAYDTRNYVAENIEENTEGMDFLGVNVPSQLYQLGMSGADQLTALALGGGVYQAVMGMDTATITARELKEDGATEAQVAVGGITAGLLEAVFEKVSIDNLISIKSADSITGIVVNALKQAGIEATEEMATEVSNIVVDTLNRRELSDTYEMYQEYIDQGYSEEEARKMVASELGKQIAWSGIGGALLGGGMGGGLSVAQSVAQKKAEPQTEAVEQTVPEVDETIEPVELSTEPVELTGENSIEQTSDVLDNTEEAELDPEMTDLEAYAEGMTPHMAQTFHENYNGEDAKGYALAFNLAYQYGSEAIGVETALKNKGVLSESQAMAIYKAGIESRGTNVKQARINALVAEAQKKGIVGKTKGVFKNDGSVDVKKLTPSQRTHYNFLEQFSQAFGINVTVSLKGEEEGFNGHYVRETNTITIDLNAVETGAKGIGAAVIPTLTHEVTHWIKNKAPKAYQALQEGVLNVLTANSTRNADQLIEEEIARLKSKGHSSTREDAIDEIVARACEDMLAGSEKMKELTAHLDEATKKTVKEKIKQLLDEVKAFLTKLYHEVSGQKEAKFLWNLTEEFNEIQKKWDAAFGEAVEANKVVDFTDKSNGVQFADRGTYCELYSNVSNILTREEYNLYVEKVGEIKRKYWFPKSRDGCRIFMIGNKLVYNKGGYSRNRILRVVSIDTRNKEDYEYVTFAQGDIINEYEKRPEYERTSFSDFARIERLNIKNDFGIQITIREYTNDSAVSVGKNGLGKQAQVRPRVNYHFEDEQDGTGNDSASGRSKTQYSDRDLAPTFYSHMGRVIDGIKQNKLGANSVVNYLKGKGVKDEEIKWSGIETFLEGKKSVTKEELQKFARGSMLEIEESMNHSDNYMRLEGLVNKYMGVPMDKFYDDDGFINTRSLREDVDWFHENGKITETQWRELRLAIRDLWNAGTTKWHDYRMVGGTNYRELLFKLPNEDYSNASMREHWDEKGILAHARIQDFETEDGKMLFVEEIQSDWHNEGKKRGYQKKIKPYYYEDWKVSVEEHPVVKKIVKSYPALNVEIVIETIKSGVRYGITDKLADYYANNFGFKMTDEEKALFNEIPENYMKIDRHLEGIPDAPFKNNYHEYVIKRLLRVAAEEGYDSIGWTTADMQSERWSEKYAEGYRIEYDQDIPKFLNKYGKKWGGKVDKVEIESGDEVWHFSIPASMKESVLYEGQVMYSDRDIEFSSRDTQTVYDEAGETERLRKENKMLKELVAELRNIIANTTTNGHDLSNVKLNAIAGHLRNVANSTVDKARLVADLRELYTYIMTEKDATEADIFERALYVSRRVLMESKGRKNGDAYAQSVLDEIKSRGVKLNDAQIKEAKILYGNRWHQILRGCLNIKADGIPLDSQWSEWAKAYPDTFKAVGDTEQINHIVDIVNNLKETANLIENINTQDNQRAMAVDILEDFWQVAPLTKESRESKDFKKLKFDHRKSVQAAKDYYKDLEEKSLRDAKEQHRRVLEEVRARYEKREKESKELHKKRMDDYKENLDKKAMIAKITKDSKTLNKWLVEGNKNRPVPDVLRKPVVALLSAIDFSSKQLLNHGIPTKRDESLKEAFRQVTEMALGVANARIEDGDLSDYGGYVDFPKGFAEDVIRISNDVNKIGDRINADNGYILNQMTMEQLEDLAKIVTTMKHSITTMNKCLATRKKEEITALATSTIAELEEVGARKNATKGANMAKDMLNFDMALPVYVFDRFGAGGKTVFSSMQDGWDKLAYNADKIVKFVKATYDAKDAIKWSKETFEVELLDATSDKKNPTYNKVKMTVAQAMSIYCLYKRPQAKQHMLVGGIRVATFKDGKTEFVQADGSTISSTEIEGIISRLTDEQKKVADALQKFMIDVCADWGNEVSMLRHGYKAFGEEFYFPIKVESNNIITDETNENENSIFRLLNMGFTKKTNPKADNKLVVYDIFDVFANHASDMAKYNALALPILDMIKWFNYSERVPSTDRNSKQKGDFSVKKSLEKAYGNNAKRYITQMLQDVNGQIVNKSGTQIVETLVRNYKVAAVAGNIRVVFLQPTSIVRALTLMNGKYIAKAMAGKPKITEAKEHCGIAMWKSFGFYDTSIQRGITEIIKNEKTAKDKITDKFLWGVGKADELTWGYLWKACEYEIREKHTDLKIGSDEYYQAVNDRLRDIIYRTQVVDSSLTRSQVMRNKNGWAQIITPFMSEPTVAYNMLHGAFFEWSMDARKEGSYKRTLKKHGKKFARVFGAYTLTAGMAAIVQALTDALRDTDDDEEKEVVEEFIAELPKNFFDNFKANLNILNNIPLVKEVFSIAKGYDSTRMDTAFISSGYYAVKNTQKLLNDDATVYKTVYSWAKAFSQASGIPVGNAMRDAVAMWNKTIGEIYPNLKIE